MAHTLLHMNGFDAGNDLASDYSGSEYISNLSYLTSFGGTPAPFGYGRFLYFGGFYGSGVLFPSLSGGPFTTLCVSGRFCLITWNAGTAASEITFIRFWDSLAGQPQVDIRAYFNPLVNRVQIRAYRGTTLLDTATVTVSCNDQGAWFWISVLVTVNSSSGNVKIRLGPESTLAMNFTGNTQNTGNTRIDQARVGAIQLNSGSGTEIMMDDFFITSALSSDSPLTERRIQGAIVPTGNDVVQWTPSAGANWQNVNDINYNADTNYNSSNTSGQQDTFVTTWPNIGNVIHAVKVGAVARKDDAGTQNINVVIKVGANSYASANFPIDTIYRRYSNTWLQNPATSSAWAQSDFSANLKFGYKVA
jgi:hypothetical protein